MPKTTSAMPIGVIENTPRAGSPFRASMSLASRKAGALTRVNVVPSDAASDIGISRREAGRPVSRPCRNSSGSIIAVTITWWVNADSAATAGITTDCNPPGGACLDTGRNLAQSLDRAGRSWRMYAESMPAPCTTANTALYAVKHNPFLYFPSVTGDAGYCRSHDVPYDRLAADLATPSSLPDLAFVSPDLCDDMHDCSIAHGDAWLQENVPRILDSPAFTRQNSLLVVTFDEGDAADNVVPCLFAGPAARSHTVDAQPFTHYSLLRTVEDATRYIASCLS